MKVGGNERVVAGEEWGLSGEEWGLSGEDWGLSGEERGSGVEETEFEMEGRAGETSCSWEEGGFGGEGGDLVGKT